MRDCPSCDYPFRSVLVAEYNKPSLLKYNLAGPVLSLCQCEMCQMIYVDGGQVDQAWFDNYYLKFYKTDDKPFADARLESLARCVKGYFKNIQLATVLDIGGTDGELKKKLEALDLLCLASGVGDIDRFSFDVVVLSHVLEHIYDVQAMMARVQMALVPGGLLFIEVPIWLTDDFAGYDNHWQHINKFTPGALENILKQNGFDVVVSEQIADYREYKVWRIIGRMA